MRISKGEHHGGVDGGRSQDADDGGSCQIQTTARTWTLSKTNGGRSHGGIRRVGDSGGTKETKRLGDTEGLSSRAALAKEGPKD